MTSWLAALDGDGLAAVLSRRPDATAGSIPRTLDELGQRLGHPRSVERVLEAVPTPLRQVSEALLALREPRTEADLRALLERSQPDHDAAVASTLQRLYECALAWPAVDGSIGVAAGLAQVIPSPLGLGPPLRSVVDQMTAHSLRRALQKLGEPRPPGRREDAAALLRQRLADPAEVRAIVATAPASIAQQLYAIAGNGDTVGPDGGEFDRDGIESDGRDGSGFHGRVIGSFFARVDDVLDDDPLDARARGVTGLGFHDFSYGGFAQRYEAERWAIERGLMGGNTFGGATYLPAEITLALRGTAFHAPFTPHPPPIPSADVDPATVESGAAAAATDFAGQTMAVLDLIARAPLAQLKSGGVGMRELARVAKTVDIDPAAVRLAVELIAELGLVAMDSGFLRTTETYSTWRELDPPAAYASLLDAWLAMTFTPTVTTDFDGRTIGLLHRRGAHDDAPAARDVLLTVLASLPPGRATTRAGVAPALVWARPSVRRLRQDANAPYATVWAEAERLGVIAAGALSRIGHAIDDRDGHAPDAVLRSTLPASTDSARFGSDLTVLVPGSPSARVSSLLDRTADRESRGAGVTWRFSPGSVRRALDEGSDPDDLLAALDDIAVGELPQPLRYLINDVARRHGELQVAAARTSAARTRCCWPRSPPIVGSAGSTCASLLPPSSPAESPRPTPWPPCARPVTSRCPTPTIHPVQLRQPPARRGFRGHPPVPRPGHPSSSGAVAPRAAHPAGRFRPQPWPLICWPSPRATAPARSFARAGSITPRSVRRQPNAWTWPPSKPRTSWAS